MFVIVRHGNTFAEGEAPRRIGARTDLPLTIQGEAQADALGRHFDALGIRFARALAAPLARTRVTAQQILARQARPPALQICDWLREIDHGPDENQPEPVVLARIGRPALDAWDARAEPPPGWIVDADARRQAWRALFDAAAPSPSEPVLVVTSNGVARLALTCDPALAAAMAKLSSLKLPTGSYGVIDRTATGALDIAAWGERP